MRIDLYRWTVAEDVRPGDVVLDADGTELEVDAVEIGRDTVSLLCWPADRERTTRRTSLHHRRGGKVRCALSSDEVSRLFDWLGAHTGRTPTVMGDDTHESWALDIDGVVLAVIFARPAEPMVTAAGTVLTDADVEALAVEAEAGYDLPKVPDPAVAW